MEGSDAPACLYCVELTPCSTADFTRLAHACRTLCSRMVRPIWLCSDASMLSTFCPACVAQDLGTACHCEVSY